MSGNNPRKGWFDDVDPEQAKEDADTMERDFGIIQAAIADNPDLPPDFIKQAIAAKDEEIIEGYVFGDDTAN